MPRGKLTPEQRAEIKALREKGTGTRALVALYGVSRNRVWQITRNDGYPRRARPNNAKEFNRLEAFKRLDEINAREKQKHLSLSRLAALASTSVTMVKKYLGEG